MVSVGAAEERRERMDQVGLDRMSLGDGVGECDFVANVARG